MNTEKYVHRGKVENNCSYTALLSSSEYLRFVCMYNTGLASATQCACVHCLNLTERKKLNYKLVKYIFLLLIYY
jgi:hypothetical protein